ncbi:hypothetical protein FACS1894191_4310 [Clostridia bacterium]|nr:hypothetical protein FACS1894191_4310 [Clostridia bacterium]
MAITTKKETSLDWFDELEVSKQDLPNSPYDIIMIGRNSSNVFHLDVNSDLNWENAWQEGGAINIPILPRHSDVDELNDALAKANHFPSWARSDIKLMLNIDWFEHEFSYTLYATLIPGKYDDEEWNREYLEHLKKKDKRDRQNGIDFEKELRLPDAEWFKEYLSDSRQYWGSEENSTFRQNWEHDYMEYWSVEFPFHSQVKLLTNVFELIGIRELAINN